MKIVLSQQLQLNFDQSTPEQIMTWMAHNAATKITPMMERICNYRKNLLNQKAKLSTQEPDHQTYIQKSQNLRQELIRTQQEFAQLAKRALI